MSRDAREPTAVAERRRCVASPAGHWHRWPAVALAAALLAGCAVGPNYTRPTIQAPEGFRGQVGPAEAASLADLPWWEVFQDPVLQGLILDALQSNYDLRTAIARVEQARALVGVARAPLFPQVGYQGQAARGRSFFPSTTNATFNDFLGAFDLAWELDVWGRIRRSTEAAGAELLADEEVRRGIMLSLVSDVATAYLELLELDLELQIARDTTDSFQQTLDLFTRRYEGGVGSKLQTSRAEGALAQAEASIPDLERRIVQKENQIAVLLGRSPGPILRGIPLVEQTTPPATPPGLPSQLLERRPDVRQAEDLLISANAQVGVAVANFFPRIGLTSLYGGESTELKNVVKGAGSIWSVAGSLTGPIFTGGQNLEQYRAQVAVFEQSKAQYEQSILQALREVSDALVAQTKLVGVRAARERAVRALQESVRLSLLRYNQGLASYYEVLEAQQQLFPAENALAQVERDQLLVVVGLYRALGGGWQLEDAAWSSAKASGGGS